MQPDVIQPVQSVVVAIALGSLVAAWAFQHFHAPDRTEDIRFSVPQQRYFVPVGIPISIMLPVYAALVLALYQRVRVANKGTDLIGCWTVVERSRHAPNAQICGRCSLRLLFGRRSCPHFSSGSW